jgi:hypothetical protein
LAVVILQWMALLSFSDTQQSAAFKVGITHRLFWNPLLGKREQTNNEVASSLYDRKLSH